MHVCRKLILEHFSIKNLKPIVTELFLFSPINVIGQSYKVDIRHSCDNTHTHIYTHIHTYIRTYIYIYTFFFSIVTTMGWVGFDPEHQCWKYYAVLVELQGSWPLRY